MLKLRSTRLRCPRVRLLNGIVGPSTFRTITPDDALAWLNGFSFDDLLPSTKASCLQIADDIRNGRWNPNLRRFVINPHRFVANGHRRLVAISLAGIAVEARVAHATQMHRHRWTLGLRPQPEWLYRWRRAVIAASRPRTEGAQ